MKIKNGKYFLQFPDKTTGVLRDYELISRHADGRLMTEALVDNVTYFRAGTLFLKKEETPNELVDRTVEGLGSKYLSLGGGVVKGNVDVKRVDGLTTFMRIGRYTQNSGMPAIKAVLDTGTEYNLLAASPDGRGTILSGDSYIQLSVGSTNNLAAYNGRTTMRADLVVGGEGLASAKLHVLGSGTTAATASFLVQNSAAKNVLRVLDDSTVSFFPGASTDESIQIGVTPQSLIPGINYVDPSGAKRRVFYAQPQITYIEAPSAVFLRASNAEAAVIQWSSATFANKIAAGDLSPGPGRLFVKGAGPDATTVNTSFANSANVELFKVLNDGTTTVKGDVDVTDLGKGLIIKSPNGSRYRVVVSDTGALTASLLV